MVQFKNVSKVFKSGNKTAVKDVSFVINEGEFVFLIGPSGSGKTTLIELLIRDEKPTDGKIYLNDQDITNISRGKVYRLRRQMGVIFQDYKLIEDKTAYENVAFAMEAAGKKNHEIKDTVPYVLDIVGLGDRMDAFPVQLSGGEQQRVAIARAIANNPKLLIADEPTGNLDPASAWDIVQILTKINNWGTTVIMSTHGTDIVNTLNKRVIQMENGVMVRDDSKGQYEFTSKADPDTIEQIRKSSTRTSKTKSSYKLDISKDLDFSKKENIDEAIPEEEVAEDKAEEMIDENKPELEAIKPRGLFGRFFSKSKEDQSESTEGEMGEDDEVEEMDIKEDAKVEEEREISDKEFEKKMESMVDESMEEINDETKKEDSEEGTKMHLQLNGSSLGLASSIKDEKKPEKVQKKKNHVEDKFLDTFYDEVKDEDIDKLDLPKGLKKDLKSVGYEKIGQIIKDGPKKLLKKNIITEKEIESIAKAISKLSMNK